MIVRCPETGYSVRSKSRSCGKCEVCKETQRRLRREKQDREKALTEELVERLPTPAWQERRRRNAQSEHGLRYYLKNRERILERNRRRRMSNPEAYMARGIRARSKKLGWPIPSVEELVVLIRNAVRCPVCGVELTTGDGEGHKPDGKSVDRFDPSLGYVHGNMRILCLRCNVLKRDATAEELRRLTDWMDAGGPPSF